MRIIDKHKDFYDYLQSPTDNLVFDRRNSFLLTKNKVYDEYLRYTDKPILLLLQCCNTFWMFLVNRTNDKRYYDLELLKNWKDYTKERKLIDVHIIEPNFVVSHRVHKDETQFIREEVDEIAKNFKYSFNLTQDTQYTSLKLGWKEEVKTIPILKESGVASFINPIEIFTSIEEYLSLEKTASENTEPKGITDKDKVIMHGFDTKTSFRKGKKKR